jgi:hypothetical protein
VSLSSAFVGWFNAGLGYTATATVGETVVLVAYGYQSNTGTPDTGATITITAAPSGFTATDWARTPHNLRTGYSPPIITSAGSVINVGSTTPMPAVIPGEFGDYGLFYRVVGTFSTPGTKTFTITFDTAQSAPMTATASLVVTDPPTSGANLALPLQCQDGTVGWHPDESAGKLVFVTNGNYTIPNRAVRFVGAAAFELHVPTLEGEDVDAINTRIAYPRTERVRTARVACQMLFGTSSSGVPYSNLQQGMVTNWGQVADLSDNTWNTTNGLQTIRYTPWIGGPVSQFEAHVLPPVVGEVRPGIGMAFGLILEVPNPSAVLP